MSVVTSHLSPSWLFQRLVKPRSYAEASLWWGDRWPSYNIIILVGGFLGIVAYSFISSLPWRLPESSVDIDSLSMCLAPFVAMVALNVLYAYGLALELACHLVFRRWARLLGPIAFGVVLLLSLALLWLPTLTLAYQWVRWGR
ncbi:MAG: hypothetical protein M1319_06370 [Chloroflexi bacterium]|nr:hypothetical protein [Chloroflexota bacterium]